MTGAETMKFIKEADIRAKEKEAKQKEKEEIKTKALKEAQKQKNKNKNKNSYLLDMDKQVMMFGHVTTFQERMSRT